MSTNEFASNAKGNTGVSLGATALGISILDLIQNGTLAGLFGGGNNEQAKLLAENTLLKSQQYSDQQTRPIFVEQARQAEQLVGLRNEMVLREQITDGKIAATAQAAAAGLSQVQMAHAALKQVVDSFSSAYVEGNRVTPLPLPAPVPPPYWPPYPYPPFFPPPVVEPPASAAGSSETTSGSKAARG